MNTILIKKLEESADKLNAASRAAIYRTALWMGRQVDPSTTEDLVQQVWLVVLSRLRYFKSAEQLMAFFAETATRLTQAHLHRIVPPPLDSLVELDDGGYEAARVETATMARGFLEALNRLPPLSQEIVRLRYLSDLSTRDISARTGLSEMAVRARLRRTLKALSDLPAIYLARRASFKHQTPLRITTAIAERAMPSEIQEPRAEFLRGRSDSITGDELGTSHLGAVTEVTIERIEAHLHALQTGLARIESKFETLAT